MNNVIQVDFGRGECGRGYIIDIYSENREKYRVHCLAVSVQEAFDHALSKMVIRGVTAVKQMVLYRSSAQPSNTPLKLMGNPIRFWSISRPDYKKISS